ncbi:MAG: hypothetical protein AAF529_08875 [Pseudomonadota bacterium]
MTVQALQLTDIGFHHFQQAGQTWAEGTLCMVLVGDTYTPSDAHTTVADLGTGGTEAQVAADSADWIAEGGDGAPDVLANRAVNNNAGDTEYDADNSNYGANATISGVKYAALVRRVGGTVQATDPLLGTMNLRTEDGNEVSASAALFELQYALSGLFRVPKQA